MPFCADARIVGAEKIPSISSSVFPLVSGSQSQQPTNPTSEQARQTQKPCPTPTLSVSVTNVAAMTQFETQFAQTDWALAFDRARIG